MKRILRLSVVVAMCLITTGAVLAIVFPRESPASDTEPWVNVPTTTSPEVLDPTGGPVSNEGNGSSQSPTASPSTIEPTQTSTGSSSSSGGSTSNGSGGQGTGKSGHGHGGSVDPPEPGHGQGHH